MAGTKAGAAKRANRGLATQLTFVVDDELLAVIGAVMRQEGVRQSEACRILMRKGAKLKALR